MKINLSKQKVVKVSVIVSILLIVILIVFKLYNINILQIIRNRINDTQKEEIGTKAQYEIMAENGENYEILITVENGNGIEKITGEDITIEGKGKQKIAIDRKLSEGQKYQIKIKPIGKEEELYTLVASKKPNIVITNMDTTGDGSTKTVNIEYPDNENLINYYSLDDGATWSEYTNELNILEADNKTIAAKSEWKEGKTIENVAEKWPLVISDSLLSATEKAIMKNNTRYRIAVKDEEYKVHTYVQNGDLNLEQNATYGWAKDVGNATEDAKCMIILKVNGNLTINNGVTLTSYGNNYGGPKGMLLYVTGNLENSGTITMTARGAKAVGQNVYMWKNQNTTNGEYEFIPKEGANGAVGVQSTDSKGCVGANGNTGIGRQTGGGGSGGVYGKSYNNVTFYSGAGAQGTSYSGGTGGGGAYGTTGHSLGYQYYVNASGDPGEKNGRVGGLGASGSATSSYKCGQGAGNPGGTNGTGGTLIIYAQIFNNIGTISANGCQGGSGKVSGIVFDSGGGGSGAGSINIFYNTMQNKGTINTIGGTGGAGYEITNMGGAGGTGTITIGSILYGTYENYE